MQKILNLLLISIIAMTANAQYANDTLYEVNRHIEHSQSEFVSSDINYSYKQTKEWKTYKALNISGWCALGVGVPMTLYGVFGMAYGVGIGGGDPDPMYITITSVGGAVALSSIPLLIIANKYKKKAKMNNLSVDLTNINTRNYLGNFIQSPAINLSYNF